MSLFLFAKFKISKFHLLILIILLLLVYQSATVILHKKPKPSSIRIIIQSEQTIKLLTILATNNVLNGSVVAFATECGSPETELEQMIIHSP